ncbi:MAG: DMT family transporter [Planctomycetes bacterium]|nr:DMT family transporter [Planctomycetota bacterium]
MAEALAKLHISVFLAGFTGIFGKLITLNDGLLVWWRIALATVLLYPMLGRTGTGTGRAPALARPDALRLSWDVVWVGGLQSAHWVLFYASIRASNVSVALVCISLMGFFSAIFSPLILKTRWSFREFLFSGITVVGIALIFHFDTRYRLGIGIGVVSSAVASLFVVCNKRIADKKPAEILFFQEMLGGLMLLTLFMPVYLLMFPAPSVLPSWSDFAWLVLLALVGTNILYILQLQSLRHISAFTVNLSLNLEPVYAIILASLFFGESRDYTVSFFIGLALIILSVLLQSYAVWRERDANPTRQAEIS